MMQWDVLLYVEDDEQYAELLLCTLKQGGFQHRLVHLPSAIEAISYLKGEGKYSDREAFPIPGVLLADLKMPRLSGLELLRWVREESKYRNLPFVVLTSSDDLQDIKTAYSLGANSFLIKPPSIADLKEMMQALDNFWMKYNVTAE